MEGLELTYYLALHCTSGIGSRRLLALVEYFQSAERAFQAPEWELKKVPGVGDLVAGQFAREREAALEEARAQLERMPEDTAIVTYFDAAYPELLKTISAPPPLLFVRGNVELLSEERMLAIVGSRKTSDYGRRAAKEFAEGFARERVAVVSGFAKGIDTIAHQSAFESGGKTIAVLGSGVDVIYPYTNKAFSEELIASGRGAIVSELSLGTKPDARHFPWRNRIVSGLARATLIVESEAEGGSMITAALALEAGREVFAVPGDVYRPSSGGPNQLIRDKSARPASAPEQVLADVGWIGRRAEARPRTIDRTALNLFETQIVDILEAAGGPLQIDAIAARAGFEVQDLLYQLLQLELKSIVRQIAGKQFVLQ